MIYSTIRIKRKDRKRAELALQLAGITIYRPTGAVLVTSTQTFPVSIKPINSPIT
jgi:hypothetical protein